MRIEQNAKEALLEWMRSAELQLDFESCLEQFGIKDVQILKLVDTNVFACATKKGERYELRIQANRSKVQIWVDHNGRRSYYLIEQGTIQRA